VSAKGTRGHQRHDLAALFDDQAPSPRRGHDALRKGHFDLNDEAGQWIDSFARVAVWLRGHAVKYETVPRWEPVRVRPSLNAHEPVLTHGFGYVHPVDAI